MQRSTLHLVLVVYFICEFPAEVKEDLWLIGLRCNVETSVAYLGFAVKIDAQVLEGLQDGKMPSVASDVHAHEARSVRPGDPLAGGVFSVLAGGIVEQFEEEMPGALRSSVV